MIFGHPPTVGKYLAGGFNKTQSLAGTEPPNRVVLLQFGNMDAVKAWRKEGEADLENDVGEKYAKFRGYAVEGVAQCGKLQAHALGG